MAQEFTTLTAISSNGPTDSGIYGLCYLSGCPAEVTWAIGVPSVAIKKMVDGHPEDDPKPPVTQNPFNGTKKRVRNKPICRVVVVRYCFKIVPN